MEFSRFPSDLTPTKAKWAENSEGMIRQTGSKHNMFIEKFRRESII
jgi:hypothetical protein